jgi:hypothetical protein
MVAVIVTAAFCHLCFIGLVTICHPIDHPLVVNTDPDFAIVAELVIAFRPATFVPEKEKAKFFQICFTVDFYANSSFEPKY